MKIWSARLALRLGKASFALQSVYFLRKTYSMLESDDLSALSIGVAVGAAVIVAALIVLGLVCGLLAFVINSTEATAGLVGLAVLSGCGKSLLF
jgi:hypothetical protein